MAKVHLRMPETKFGPEAKYGPAMGLGELEVILGAICEAQDMV